MTRKIDRSVLLKARQLQQANDEIERASGDFLSKAEEARRLIGLYRWQEYDVNTRPNDILSQLKFVESDSAVYEYQSDPMPSFSLKKTND